METEMKQEIGHVYYTGLDQIELWKNQRDLNRNLVDNIVKSQLEYYKKYKEFTFPGVLVIVNFDDKYYLIDGQHRFESLKILYDKHAHNVRIAIQIYTCNDEKQIDELYAMLNHINSNNCMVTDGKIDLDGVKLKQIKTILKEKYGYKIWDDIKTPCPYVNTKALDMEFKNCKYFHIKTVDEIISAIEEQNNNYSLVLKNTNKVKYNTMINDGGFSLQYRDPKARWVRTLF
jgi:translation initiation factor 1 (eIF-1/SUI1)